MRFSTEISFALIFKRGDIPATDDIGRVGEFNIGASVPEAIDSQSWEGDKVLLWFAGWVFALNCENGMTDLFDDDGASCLILR